MVVSVQTGSAVSVEVVFIIRDRFHFADSAPKYCVCVQVLQCVWCYVCEFTEFVHACLLRVEGSPD